ncbi:PPE family protein [Rhodococcus qingshengii]|uniref:PPE family protein n=1 Tax=Rhodococcus qingshengii TaxID=334542 RepID=UPI00287F5E06|nr:PPE family protein [Rhodococcus qingshengii]
MGVEPWGLYPPEINAGRYDAGAGPLAWVAAATEWGLMAAMVAETQAALGLQVGSITGQWSGVAPIKMSAATMPFATWLNEMAGVAALNVERSVGVVNAYMTGRAAMVPLPVIVANRVAARTAQVLGAMGAVNTEMVRLEIEYAAFWTHNSSTMTVYDTAVQAATTPTPVPPPPPLVVDAVGGAPAHAQLQQLGQQLGQPGTNPLGMGGRSLTSAIPSRYAGPSLSNSSSLARMLGSGAGSGAAFGGRGASAGGGGGGGAGGVRGGFGGGLGGLLTPPLTSFNGPNLANAGQSGPAFGGVQNSPTTAKAAGSMAPPMGRGSRLQQALDERDREEITAAEQEFTVRPEMSENDGEQSREEISVPAQLR